MGKRGKKAAAKKVSKFIDMEADESDSDAGCKDDPDKFKRKPFLPAYSSLEYYEEDELRPSTIRLDQNLLKRLEQQAIKDELAYNMKMEAGHVSEHEEADDRDSFIVKNEFDNEMEDFDMEQLVGRDVTLPSNRDSKLWRLKVKPGFERQIVLRLTNKLIHHLNIGQPLMVLQVFECQTSQGCVYVEAYKLSHVEQLTRNMSGIYARGLKMIPIKEMTDVMKACSAMRENPVQPL